MKRKFYPLFFLFVGFLISINAQSIKGKVVANGSPVSFANIVLNTNKKGVSANNDGVFVIENITVKRDAITGNKLNHNCEVVIFASIGRKFDVFFILICIQKIDNG